MKIAPSPSAGKAAGSNKRAVVRRVAFAVCVALLAAALAGAAYVAAQSPAVPVVATVRHAPTLNGRVEGSVQMLAGEYLNLNSGSVVKGDLLVPGTPNVVINGSPIYQGTVNGTGSAQPLNYQVTLNSGSEVRHVRRRIDPVALAPVPVPPAPAGTRYVSINSAGQSVGTWATVRNLTLNSNVGAYAVPPGTYGSFTANGGSSFVLGVVGATQAAVYNFEDITLNSLANLSVVGPVVVNVANRVSVNSSCVVGSATNPRWLALNVSRYDVTINGGELNGDVRAPAGTVNLSGGRLRGSVASDRLNLNGGATLVGVQTDTTAPTVTITQPAEGLLTRDASVNVSGTFADESATTVTINGVAAAVSGNSFAATVPLTEGPNQLLVTATDATGNRSQVGRSVIRDTVAPGLTINQPPAGALVGQAQVTVTGTFSDAHAVSVAVNGVAASTAGDTYTATVSMADGASTLEVVALDAAGNQSRATRSLTIDTQPPFLNVEKPVDGSYVKTVLVMGAVADATLLGVTANGTSLTVEGTSFSGELTLPEGEHQIRIVAADRTGRTTESVRAVKVDRTPPALGELSPAQDTIVNAATLTVQGRVSDSSPVTVTVDQVEASVGADGRFAASDVPLVEGNNGLQVSAADEAGNITELMLRLRGRDVTAPAAAQLFPLTSPTRLTYQSIQGRAEPGATVSVTGALEPVTTNTAEGSGLFIANVKLAAGTNSLTVVVTDAAGNMSEPAQVSITSDPGLPPPDAGRPAQINIGTGNAQRTLPGSELPRPLIAIVTDRAGAPVSGVPVTFLIMAGGGSLVGGSETVTVETDASGYARARYVAGDELGVQLVRANFSGNRSTPADFTSEALELSPDGRTSVSGVVLDQNLRALPNVLVRAGGQQTRSGADGRFRLENVASGPHQLLELIGRDQVALPGRWPNISHDLDVLPGVNNHLGRPLFLPKVNEGVVMPLDANNVVTRDTVYELPVVGGEPPVRITARAGTRVQFPPDVTDKRLSVTRIAADRIPMPLEDGRATNLYVSVQPSGALFDPPLEVSFPNVDQQPPDSEVLLMSFDHDAGRYVKVGTGRVSGDGKRVTSDPGSGIRVGAWHGLPPAPPQPEVTVLGHIQVEGNPAFEDQTIVDAEAWVEGERAVLTTNVSPLSDAKRLDFRATFSRLPGSAAFVSSMQAKAKTVKGKIRFVTPNGSPVTAPKDTGVGQNEYTFSAANPGVLEVNIVTNVVPQAALTADFADRVTFSISDIDGSVREWDAANPDGKAAINGTQLTARVTFTGLPPNNAAFGPKTVRVLIDGKVVGSRVIEVFYPRDEANHPGGVAADPNWFYYWNQAAGGGNAIFDPALPVFGRAPKMRLWDTYNGPPDRVLFSDMVIGNDSRRDGSHQAVSGIDLFANTYRHENRHVTQIVQNNAQPFYQGVTGALANAPGTGWSFNFPFNPPPGRWNHFTDADGSGTFNAGDTDLDTNRNDLANTLEPTAADKAACHSGAAAGAAIECQAERSETIPQNRFLKSDWGSPGKQHLTSSPVD